jgi:hypothetical protein
MQCEGLKEISGSLRYFIAPNELKAILEEVRAKHQLTCIMENFISKKIHVASPNAGLDLERGIDRINLAPGHFEEHDLSFTALSHLPYSEGWVTVDMYIRDPGILYMNRISFRTNVKSTRRLFNHVKRRILSIMNRGVIIFDRTEQKESRVDGIYSSPGARKLIEEGVVWMQFGVQTQQYLPMPPNP